MFQAIGLGQIQLPPIEVEWLPKPVYGFKCLSQTWLMKFRVLGAGDAELHISVSGLEAQALSGPIDFF